MITGSGKSTETDFSGIRSLSPVLFIPAGVMLASVLVVFPGIFDTTTTSRLALYPLSGALLLLAGRKTVPANHLIAFLLLVSLPVLSVIWAGIPIQCITSIVRWASFGMMLAGLGGIARNRDNTRILIVSMIFAACIASLLSLVMANDMPAGNPNRLGPFLALSVVAVVSGAAGIRGFLRFAVCALLLVGLYYTYFYIGWIAVLLGTGWFLLNRKFTGLRPCWLILVMAAGQITFILLPGLTGKMPPTLELRSCIWRTSTGLAARTFPLGTGAGQVRLDIYTLGSSELRSIAGEEKRVDFLHSDLLTLPVEIGLPGLIVLGLLAWWIISSNLKGAEAALLITVWPFISTDLPLATPLGALPVALVLALTLARGRKKISLHWTVPAALGLLSLFWGLTVVRGYSYLEEGRKSAAYGDPDYSVSAFEAAGKSIPFEERAFLFLARSRYDSGNIIMALEAINRFTSIYPSYWRGWLLQGEIQASLDRVDAAAESFLMAVRTSPGELLNRQTLALNALAVIPKNHDDRLLLAQVIIHQDFPCFLPPPIENVVVDWSMRSAELAKLLEDTDPEVSKELWLEVARYLSDTKHVLGEERLGDIRMVISNALTAGESFDCISLERLVCQLNHVREHLRIN